MTLFVEEARDRVELPAPTLERWQPLRSGLLNLFHYDYQEFWFEGGRLLLRGGNGTGKSRVLALTLPFLLDGEASPARMEPDGDSAKRLAWNLLVDEHEERQGYTFLELGRLENGQEEYWTLGCFLRATKGKKADRVFFMTRQRVGETLFLKSPQGFAIGKDALQQAVGSQGQLFDTAAAYRKAVDAELFGLGEQRYKALMDLLIQLRQPQLSRNLDEGRLSEALSQSLPPLARQLVDDLADAFRSLQTERERNQRMKSALKSLDQFLRDYLAYAKVATRRRAERLRETQNRYEECQRQHRQLGQSLRDSQRERDGALSGMAELEQRQTALRAREAALREGPEAQDAGRLLQAQEARSRSRARAGDAEAVLRTEGSSHQRARTALANAQTELEEARREEQVSVERCQELAARADFSWGVDDLDQARRHLKERREAIAQLIRWNEQVASAEQKLAQQKERLDDAQGRLEEALHNTQEAEKARKQATEAYLEGMTSWQEQCRWLRVADLPELFSNVREWAQDPEGESPFQLPIESLWRSRLEEFARRRSQNRHSREALEDAIAEGESELGELRRGRHIPPPAPHTRDPSVREGREGAPLWQLTEFQAGLSEREQAGLEAALESSGLLDAWFDPETTSLRSVQGDTLLALSLTSREPEQHLGQFLAPSHTEHGDAVAALLRLIGVSGAGDHWVALDGQWQLGPLRGGWNKATAQHIGQTAREAARQARMAALELELEELRAELRRLEQANAELRREEQEAEKEWKAMPGPSAVLKAFAELQASQRIVLEARRQVERCHEKVHSARQILEEAIRERDLGAADLGLREWVARLSELEQLSESYARTLDRLAYERKTRRGREDSVAHQAQLEREAMDRLAAARERHQQAEQEFLEQAERCRVLEQNLGAKVEDYHRQLKETSSDLRSVEQALKAGQLRLQAVERKAVELEVRVENAERELAQVESLRDEAWRGFNLLVTLGLLGLQKLLEDKKELSVTAAVDLARKVLKDGPTSDAAAWDRVCKRVMDKANGFSNDMLLNDYRVSQEPSDDLFLFTVRVEDKDLELSELRSHLEALIDHQEMLLSAKDREILENHLVGDVSFQLHELLNRAEAWVEEMNDELSQRPTARGMMLRFRWLAAADAPPDFVELRAILMRTGGTWTSEERERLGRFLELRIQQAKEDDPSGTWQGHLEVAFDYRRWHTFVVERRQDNGPWKRLTRRTHGTGSGGEKALALTMPQFAAAAAFYRSVPKAPRFILLDEVFVGIDKTMRRQCMDLLRVFELDFVMTSETEWGCYDTVPELAIYHLHVWPDRKAIGVTRWLWRGNQRTPMPNVHAPLAP